MNAEQNGKVNSKPRWKIQGYAKERSLKNEDAAAGRFFLRVAKPLYGAEAQYRYVQCWTYLRGLDDIVDNGDYPTRTGKIMTAELHDLDLMLSNEQPAVSPDFTARQNLLNGLDQMTSERKIAILGSIHDVAQGIAMDNDAILAQKPLPEEQLGRRYLLTSKPVFQFTNQLFFGYPLIEKQSPDLDALFSTWIRYDALRDLNSDLAAGLVLFPQRELDSYGIIFQAGEPLPPQLEDFYHDQSPIVQAQLRERSGVIFDTSAPKHFATGLYGYFRSRAPKLRRTPYPVKPDTRFAQNLKETNLEY